MKASARQIIDQAAIDIASSSRELWTPKLVRDALVDAYRMLQRVGGKVGPAHLKAYWPEYQIDQADFVEQSLAQTLKQQRQPASYRTRMNVTRMEMVLTGWRDEDGREQAPWMGGPLLALPDLRRVLRTWIFSELRGEPFKELCAKRGWVYTTHLTWRDRAAGIIAQRLNAAKMEVWR